MDSICEEPGIDVSIENDKHAYFLSGESILKEGESSHHAYQLIAGTAKVFRGGDVIATLRAGEYFGSIAAMTSSKRNATVIAETNCVAQRIERKRFLAMVKMDPDMLKKMK